MQFSHFSSLSLPFSLDWSCENALANFMRQRGELSASRGHRRAVKPDATACRRLTIRLRFRFNSVREPWINISSRMRCYQPRFLAPARRESLFLRFFLHRLSRPGRFILLRFWPFSFVALLQDVFAREIDMAGLTTRGRRKVLPFGSQSLGTSDGEKLTVARPLQRTMQCINGCCRTETHSSYHYYLLLM